MRRRSFAAALALAAAFPALAHDTWLVPRKSAVARGGFVRIDLTSGGEFPALDFAIAPDRIARSGLRLDGKSLRFSGRDRQKHSLVLARAVDRAGVAAAWVELKPKSLELKPEEVAHYLEEIGETEALGKQLAGRPPARWREVYRKHAKTFLRVGTPQGDRSWGEPVGMALEIVPESDPTALAAGDVLPVRVLEGGRPLANFPLAAVSAGRKDRRIIRTDAEGRTRITLDRAGPWLLAGTRLSPSTKPGVEWESDFTTLTLAVAAGPGAAPPPPAPRPAELVPDQPFTGTPRAADRPYERVIRWREAGESEDALLARVRNENVRYELTTAEIQKLRVAGVPPAVIEAMLQSGRTLTPTPR
jgi:uncharacterized GH25 family protein